MNRRTDRGSTTAELATALPVLVVLLTVAVGLVAAVGAQLRCVDAAREGARAAARGETPGRVVGLARQVAPAGARVQLASAGVDTVAVTVTARVPVAGRLLSSLSVRGRAVALVEPGVPP